MPALERTLYSGMISEGDRVLEFEREFLSKFELPAGLSLSSCTAALHLALILAGVRPGDEVISTVVTTEPTNIAILQAGGRIVWADVDPRSGNIHPESVADRITARTRAVMAVHYAGVPASLGKLRAVCSARKLPLIEDCAHALGARYDGRLVGADSDYAAFSFQAIKHMTTVDGGLLACRNPADIDQGRRLRWFGIDRRVPRSDALITETGYKYHMNDVTAAIGLAQLPLISSALERHRENGRWFDAKLTGIRDVCLCEWDENATPAYWLYTVLVERRDDFVRALAGRGVASGTVIKRNDLHPVFRESAAALPGADEFMTRMAHIPCGWWVGPEEREYILSVIKEGW